MADKVDEAAKEAPAVKADTGGVVLEMRPSSDFARRPSYDATRKAGRASASHLGNDDLNLAAKVSVEREASAKNLTAVKPVSTALEDHEIEAGSFVQPKDAFEKSEGLTSEVAAKKLAFHGRNELPEKKVPKWYVFVSQLWQPMPIMIWLAALVELIIANYPDMGILLFIQFANASIGYYEITKAEDAVAALKKSLKSKAIVKRDGKFQDIDAALVVPGDLVSLASGGAIPADCRVNHGQIDVDQAALTGESLPVTMFPGDECRMGSTVARGETEATVTATGANTFFGKTASLLQGDNEYSNLQKIIISIVIVLTVLSLVLSIIVLIYLLSLTDISTALSFVVVLIVASISNGD